jgi:hypothetical protein
MNIGTTAGWFMALGASLAAFALGAWFGYVFGKRGNR